MSGNMVRRWGDDRGSSTTFVVLMVVPLLMVAGLAFDGGRILTGRREAIDVAQQAALAGSQAVAGVEVRQGAVGVDAGLVKAAAHAYLQELGHTGTVVVTDTEVTVTVSQVVDMELLSVIGVGSKTVTGVGTSNLLRGVDAADS